MNRRLLHVFSTFSVGGGQRRTVELANRLGGGYRHKIVSIDGETGASHGLSPHIEVEIEHLPLVKSRGVSIKNLRRLRSLFRRSKPDLLLSYNFGTIEAALASRLAPVCPHLHFEDGFGPEEADGRQLPRRVWLRRLALSGRSRIIVPSRTLQTIALDVWGFSSERVLYIPNGIDCSRYESARAGGRSDLRRSPDELLIGAVGMLRPEKNLARLVRAFAMTKAREPTRLVIVGEGSERTSLETLAARLGIAERVTFTGFLSRPELAFRELDIYALSSDTEQMPLGMVEAMAAGLPIVATNVGDVLDLLPEAQHPLVVPKSDEKLFASCLEALLADRDRRSKLGEANRLLARKSYSIEQMTSRYASLFAEIAAAKPTRSVMGREAERPIG